MYLLSYFKTTFDESLQQWRTYYIVDDKTLVEVLRVDPFNGLTYWVPQPRTISYPERLAALQSFIQTSLISRNRGSQLKKSKEK